MSRATPAQVLVIGRLADALYEFLPGSGSSTWKNHRTFATAAAAVGLGHFWAGGSKKPAIQQLLLSTYESTPGRFEALLVSVVKESVAYRAKKANRLSRSEVETLLTLAHQLGFKLTEVRDPVFLKGLSSDGTPSTAVVPGVPDKAVIDALREKYQALVGAGPKRAEAGYAFEDLLQELFVAFGMSPREPFRNRGEQIDGSIDFDGNVYLIEARNQQRAMGDADLLVLAGRVDGHSGIGRGIYITTGCFSPDGLQAFERKGRHRIICVDGSDLWTLLEKRLPLDEVLKTKLRALVESGRVHLPVAEFSESLIRRRSL